MITLAVLSVGGARSASSRSTLSFSILPPIFHRRRPAAPSTPAVGSEASGSGGNEVTPAAPPPIETKRKEQQQQAELGFSFSPAGLLLPYHLGVASLLRDRRVRSFLPSNESLIFEEGSF